jgi:hypothetical protein
MCLSLALAQPVLPDDKITPGVVAESDASVICQKGCF